MSQFSDRTNSFSDNQSSIFADCLANSKQIFNLINTLLPIESCIERKILPLGLQENYLTLGMLNPEDIKSINFVRPIATAYGHYLNIKAIDQQTYQLIINNYLKIDRERQKSAPQERRNLQQDKNRTFIDAKQTIVSPSQSNRTTKDKTITEMPKDFDFLKEAPPQSKNAKSSDYDAKTITEMPKDFDFLKEALPQSKNAKSSDYDAKTITEMPEDFASQLTSKPPINSREQPTIIISNETQIDQSPKEYSTIISSEAQISNLTPETEEKNSELDSLDSFSISDIKAENTVKSKDFLENFTEKLSWQQLFLTALEYDTEAIYLKRYVDRGSITCGQEKKVQSSLERVPLALFCVLVNEIKTLAKLPLTGAKNTKKVALERNYQQERMILRLCFIPNKHGEDITIDILRKDRLSSYEQLQMNKMSEQALTIARQLEKTLKQMQSRFHMAKVNDIKELQTIQRQIDGYLKLLDR